MSIRAAFRAGLHTTLNTLSHIGVCLGIAVLIAAWAASPSWAPAAADPGPGADAGPSADSGSGSEPVPVSAAVDREVTADVFIWDTTTQGIGALRALQKARAAHPPAGGGTLRLVIAASSPRPTAMAAQGLAVEDIYAYHGDPLVSGFWAEFRRAVIADYKARGINAVNNEGRLVVEPEVASQQLRWFIDRGGVGRPGTTLLCAHLISARYQRGASEVVLRTAGGETIRVKAKVLIDASVEGDLALALGARYRYGLGGTVFGPATGPPPKPDGDVKDTWIQRVSTLLTLKVFSGRAPRVADLVHPSYDPADYKPDDRMAQRNVDAFASSWTMTHPLPNGKREFNETWGDYPWDIALPYTYVFGYRDDPKIRQRLRDLVLQWALDKVRYLQENKYPSVGVAAVPNRLYLREGPRVVGLRTYTGDEVSHGVASQTVVFGRYARYDVHLPVIQDHEGAFVNIPLGAVISADFPDLLIPGPLSADHLAYNSAARMEPVRANTGGAAGVIAALALSKGIAPAKVPYLDVAAELRSQGYRLAL